MMAVRVIRSAMQPESKDSPYITILASILLMFSLFLLYHHFNEVQIQNTKKVVVKKEKPQEHLVRVITLRPKPDKPKKTRPKPKARSKPKARPSAVPHATATAVAKGKNPAIDASFALPIQRYLKIIKAKAGARVLLFDPQKGQMIGEVYGNQFIMGNMNLNGISMQARDITADLSFKLKNRVLKLADAKSKPYKFLIVLPSHAEQRFKRLLANKLAQHGIQWSAVSSIQLQYYERNHHIMAQITTVMVKTRVSRPIGATIRVW